VWRQVVSQSPTEAVDPSLALNYILANNKVARLIKSGKSLSGRERNCCYLNTGGQHFANISALSGLDFADDGRAVGLVDWDQDGDLDLWLVNRTGPMVRFMRNDAHTGNRYLSVRLEGRSSNRDGIGARVEVVMKASETKPTTDARPSPLDTRHSTLDTRPSTLAKTLYAGSGFLSQSSKWVHFGLGPGAEIERIVVHWPASAKEEFTGAAADGRFRLVEGSGKAEPWPVRKRQVSLEPSRLTAPKPSGQASIWLAARAPMPHLRYQDFEHHERTLDRYAGAPVLLTLWAGWCQPCLEELREFGRHAQEFRTAGLNVVALNVDGLEAARSVEPDRLSELLRQLEYPFDVGLATARNVDKLELLYFELFGRHVALPVPSSFLIDADGWLAAIYLGPVSVDRLLSDVAQLDAGADSRRDHATPFPGRWHRPSRGANLRDVAAAYIRAGYVEDASPLLRSLVQSESNSAELNNMLGANLEHQGNESEALKYYREALRIDQDYVMALYNAGRVLKKQGQVEAAAEQFRRALRLSPNYFEAHCQFASLLESQAELAQATSHFREAVRIDPTHFQARRELGRILARQKQWDEAAKHLREATVLQPDHAATCHDLGIVLGRLGDMEGAIERFRQSLKIESDNQTVKVNLARAHFSRATSLAQEGRAADAVVHYREAIVLDSDWPAPVEGLAWILAASPDPEIRDPEEAIRLSENANRAAGGRNPNILVTLATAYASAGQFAKAVAIADRALELAAEKGDQQTAKQLEQQLLLFRAGKPYREGG
jgi:tetratricopeptide (TPR) repeat protein/peroxiredoxin